MNRLIPINSKADIFPRYQNTPIGKLLEYHDLGRTFDTYSNAEMLIGMCMDNRKHLSMPDNFAFIIRAAGANLQHSEFKVSYAIGVGGIKYIAIIGHTNCGMVNLAARKEIFIQGLIANAGWNRAQAEEHFNHFAPSSEIGNEVDFVISESKRLRVMYPAIVVAPMIYKIEDNRIYLVNEE